MQRCPNVAVVPTKFEAMSQLDPAIEPLLRCAQELREAFERVKLAAHSGDSEGWSACRFAAQPIAGRFNGLVRGLPWWRERKLRRVAGYWYDAAGGALWYRLAAFDDAEQAAYQALQRVATGEWTRRDMLVLRGKIQDAQVEDDYQNRDLNQAVLQLAKGYNAARKGKPYQEPAVVAPKSPAPLTIKDQADLRWLLSQDWQWLMIQAAAVLATARSASADRHYLPWLSDAFKRLSSTLPAAELEEIAEQWRERRSRYFDNQPPEFILVELLPRRPSTWWWRRWHHADEPLPLLGSAGSDSPRGADGTSSAGRPS